MDLKLAKLPDRTPVKIAITVRPQLGAKLNLYAELYNALYPGDGETIANLIPYMLENFLEADRNFAKAFKERESNGEAHASPPETDRRKRRVTSNVPRASTEE
ncbi:MAG TPA: DUF2274 domain-containing protein [Rhizomicrobium sp.]|nr:DUF2274 domain-containing protein [Rhizomicrobium sp.]